jgi:integrase
MKIIKSSVPEIKQTILDSHRKKVSPDITYQIKEKSRGRGQGVFVARILGNKEIDFYFKYFIDGKEKSKKIGRYGNAHGFLSLAQARSEFRKLSATYNSGIDPKVQEQEIAQKLAKEKKVQAEIKRRKQMQGSLKQLSEFYLAHLEQNAREIHYRNVIYAFKKDLFIIDPETKASDIKKEDIIRILHAITERGANVMANRMRSYLSAMFQYGIRFDDSVESHTRQVRFFIQLNPVTNVQKATRNEKRGDRSLTEGEVKIFWQALDKSGISIFKINVFKLLLLTGSRVGEIAGLRWDEINFFEKIITLPSERTKNKIPHIIPINKMMHEIIVSNPKLNDIYLFPAINNTEPQKVDGFSQAIDRLLKKINIDKFSPRDLRRTFKTLAGKAGISKEIRDRLQNHSLQDVSSLHYDKYDYLKEKRTAMDTWNDYLWGILNND